MKIPFRYGCLLLVLLATTISLAAQRNPSLKLYYDNPANASAEDDPFAWDDDRDWLQALPLGNGSLGAMVYGDVFNERIQLNEKSLWSGSTQDPNNPASAEALDEIRRLLFAGQYRDAQALTNRSMICSGQGSGHGQGLKAPYGCFQTLGNLRIRTAGGDTYTNYHRELDLNEGIIRVSYSIGDIQYRREYFISFPAQALVVRFTASKAGQLSFSCCLDRPENFSTQRVNEQLLMSGHTDNGHGAPGLKYTARLGAKTKNGHIHFTDSSLIVDNADEVVLVLAATTDFRNRDDGTEQQVQEALALPYASLRKAHQTDYQSLFGRMSIDLTPEAFPDLPTDQAILMARTSGDYRRLSEILFQYGRYLLIASSRQGCLPANLQGIWTNKIQPPWNADYHTNINLQMNYWPADVCNLGELNEPYFDFLKTLVEPGSKTAQIHYNAPGWVVHPITNIWGFTAPGEEASWGLHPAAGAWLCTHIMEHFRFSGDTAFLRDLFPTLKSSVMFYHNWMVKDPVSGHYVSGPAGSPENTFIAPDSSRCQITMGSAHDQQVIAALFADFLSAAAVLAIQDPLTDSIRKQLPLLGKPQITGDGRIMEWSEEFIEAEPGHRHMSHLWALYPGSALTPAQSPTLAKAARKSIDYRIQNGGGHTGWSAAWLINLYARLYDGNQAVQFLHNILEKATAPNLFTLHPPFQIDANLGLTAGIAEMLLQSHNDTLRLLPALPAEWPRGEIRGLRARGGYTVDIKWTNKHLKKAVIKADRTGSCVIVAEDKTREAYINKESRIIIRH